MPQTKDLTLGAKTGPKETSFPWFLIFPLCVGQPRRAAAGFRRQPGYKQFTCLFLCREANSVTVRVAHADSPDSEDVTTS